MRLNHTHDGVNLRIKPYLEWLSTLSCSVCGRKNGVCGAHGKALGKSEKGPDWQAIPLCIDCHGMEHDGKETFWDAVYRIYKKKREVLVDKYNNKYCKLYNMSIETLRIFTDV